MKEKKKKKKEREKRTRSHVVLSVKGEKKNWENNLKLVGDFATVEDFWSYFNNMRKPSGLEFNSNYHIFKSGIKPMWEDPHNAKGGKWILQCKGEEHARACLIFCARSFCFSRTSERETQRLLGDDRVVHHWRNARA